MRNCRGCRKQGSSSTQRERACRYISGDVASSISSRCVRSRVDARRSCRQRGRWLGFPLHNSGVYFWLYVGSGSWLLSIVHERGEDVIFVLDRRKCKPCTVSLFFFFFFFNFFVVYKSILRAREECCCSNRRAQRMLECLGQVVRLSFFFFFFHSPLFRFPPFWTAKDLYSDSCFAYDIALPWVTQCLFFSPLLEFHFSKFTVKAIGAPSSKSVVGHSLGCFQRPTETVESAQCRCLFLLFFFAWQRDAQFALFENVWAKWYWKRCEEMGPFP